MNIEMSNIDLELNTNAEQAARGLGVLLLNTPEYQAFLKALNLVNKNPDVQKLSTEMRSHQNALRWASADEDNHHAALARLELELEALPEVQNYRQAESAVCRLFAQADADISMAAGVPFAANARRSGCGCGG